MKVKLPPKQNKIFEIFDSEIDTLQLQEQILESLSNKNISISELDESSINNDDFFDEFDPSYIAYQFEKAIQLPKFQNTKLWFLKGPIKWLLIKLIKIYATVERKLSQNRISAVYALIHELARLRLKQKELEGEIQSLRREHFEFHDKIQGGGYKYFESEEWQERARTFLDKSDRRVISQVNAEDKILILLPDWINLLNYLSNKKIDFLALIENNRQFEYLGKFHKGQVQLIPDLSEFVQYDPFHKIILGCNASNLPAWYLDKILNNAVVNMTPGGKLFIKFSNHNISLKHPFQPAIQTNINRELLPGYLIQMGFVNPIFQRIDENEFELLTCYKP